MMDIQTTSICVALFIAVSAALTLTFIYKFAIKEKTYDEALAEQRNKPTNILLGVKTKPKEKKNKKPAKKLQSMNKEKLSTEENEVVKDPEQAESNSKNVEVQKKPHVEFKEVPEDVAPKITVGKKHPKKDKVRPILINKEKNETESEKQVNIETVSCTTNHFIELHPKDDFELFRSSGAEEAVKDDSEKSVSKTDADTQKQTHKKQIETETVTQTLKENGPSSVGSSINGFIGNTGKEKKKKKSEFNTLQQLAGDSGGPNMSVLLNLVRKAELSRSEVQVLIDLLLNKQHEAPATIDEWSEGKSDPIQKLKKQLAEKEKLLSEEQQVVTNVQAKLREIRSEHQNEKANLLQKIRSMEEAVQGKQLEANRNQQQVQQLQTQIKEEVVKYHKLREEHAALQIQRQQFEMRLGQAQESEVLITQLQSEVNELSSINNQLRMELAHFTEENVLEKERNQSFIVQLNNFQKELEQKTERSRQSEESRRQLECDLEAILKRENDLKVEIARLNNVVQQQNEEVRRLEQSTKQYRDDLEKHRDETNKLINQLTVDLQQAKEENAQIKITHVNGSLQETKEHEVRILNLQNELSSVQNQLSQAQKQSEKELTTANALTEKLKQEITELKVKYDEEKLKLEEQKSKNNELREKNWKVMEALNAAECRIKNVTPNRIKSDEDIQREFIQRLFPEIKDKEIVNPEHFKVEGEKFIKKYIDNLQKQNVKHNSDQDEHQLKLQLKHYKNVIDNTEKMLNKLQKHIEQEEINWRMQLAAKATELEAVKEACRKELQENTSRLEIQLKKEQEHKKRIIAEFHECKKDVLAQNSTNGLQ